MMNKNLFTKVLRLLISPTAQNVYWTLFGNGFYTLFTFVFFVLIAPKILGPENFGRLSALFAMTILLADLADSGIGASLSRFIPPLLRESKFEKVNRITKTAFYFEMTLATLFAFGVFISAPFLSHYVFADTGSFYVGLTTIGIIGFVLFSFFNFILSARQQFRDVAVLTSLIAAFRVIGAGIVISANQFTLVTASLLLFVSPFFSMFFVKRIPSFLNINTTKKDLMELFSFSKYLGINKIFTAIASRIDVLLLIALLGAFESGIYSAALRITQIYPLIAGSLSTVFAPRFAVYHSLKEASSFTAKVFLITLVLLFTIFIFFFIAHPFILFIFGKKYELSIPIFQALLLPMALFVCQLPFTGLILYTLKKPKIFALSSIVQLTFTIGGNIVFIPVLKIYGPIVGLTLGYFGSLAVLGAGVFYYRNNTQ